MKLIDILEMSAPELDDSEQVIKRNFLMLGIIINFSKHFGDRMIDGAEDEAGKRDNISADELLDTFDKLKDHHTRIFKEAQDFNDELKRGEFEGVIKDVFKKINIPFGLDFNKKNGKFIMTCKTIMKRNNFHVKPKDHVITV